MHKFYVHDFFVIENRGVVLTGELETPLDGYELDALKEVEVVVRDHRPKRLAVKSVERFMVSKDCKQSNIGILV